MASLSILHFPIAIKISHLLEVEKTLFCKFVAWVGSCVCLVPLWIVFIILVSSIVFFTWFLWFNWLLLLVRWLLVMRSSDRSSAATVTFRFLDLMSKRSERILHSLWLRLWRWFRLTDRGWITMTSSLSKL